MKRFKYAFQTTIALLFGALLVTACGDDEESGDSGSNLGSATIKGKVEGEVLDTCDTGCNTTPCLPYDQRLGNHDVTIKAYIDGEDLVTNPDTAREYEDKYYSTSVDNNGNYSLKVDAPNQGDVQVNIVGNDFVGQKTIVDTACGNTNTTTEQHKFEMNPSTETVTIRKGQTKFQDLDFQDSGKY